MRPKLPNHCMQRTEASRSAQLQFARLRRLAPAAHADRWADMNPLLGLLRLLVIFPGLLLMQSCATVDSIQPRLPAEVAINEDAGRWGLLLVTLRLESGKELPFIVDTGTARTLLDKSLEPTLGRPRGRITMNSWGVKKESHLYAAPKLYLGGAPLMTSSNIVTIDLRGLRSRSGPQPMGLLGLDCLRHYCIQLDFEAGKMRFMDSARLNVEKLGRAFPITIAGGRPYICHPSLAGGTSTNSLADTNTEDGKDKGRELPVGRDLPVTYSLIDTGFDADGRVDKGAIKGHDSGRVRLPECVWDGQTYTNLVVGVGEQANLLGLRFLARHLVTLDFPRQTMYLKQTSAGPLAGERQKRQSNEQGGADGRQPSH